MLLPNVATHLGFMVTDHSPKEPPVQTVEERQGPWVKHSQEKPGIDRLFDI